MSWKAEILCYNVSIVDTNNTTAKEATKPKTYDILPITFGIETKGGISSPIARRGTPLPCKRVQTFSTAINNQQSVEINILVGERPLSKYNQSMGKCILKDIPPSASGIPQINVTFEIDTSLNIKVQAVETKVNVPLIVTFDKSSIKLDDIKIASLIKRV